jgi:hypothetical protein
MLFLFEIPLVAQYRLYCYVSREQCALPSGHGGVLVRYVGVCDAFSVSCKSQNVALAFTVRLFFLICSNVSTVIHSVMYVAVREFNRYCTVSPRGARSDALRAIPTRHSSPTRELKVGHARRPAFRRLSSCKKIPRNYPRPRQDSIGKGVLRNARTPYGKQIAIQDGSYRLEKSTRREKLDRPAQGPPNAQKQRVGPAFDEKVIL